jgi:hypothetical protein
MPPVYDRLGLDRLDRLLRDAVAELLERDVLEHRDRSAAERRGAVGAVFVLAPRLVARIRQLRLGAEIDREVVPER